jgi:hypothetical protein
MLQSTLLSLQRLRSRPCDRGEAGIDACQARTTTTSRTARTKLRRVFVSKAITALLKRRVLGLLCQLKPRLGLVALFTLARGVARCQSRPDSTRISGSEYHSFPCLPSMGQTDKGTHRPDDLLMSSGRIPWHRRRHLRIANRGQMRGVYKLHNLKWRCALVLPVKLLAFDLLMAGESWAWTNLELQGVGFGPSKDQH